MTRWLIIYFTKVTQFSKLLLIDFFSWSIRIIGPVIARQALHEKDSTFLMEWCIEHFVVKIVSVLQIGANKIFVNSNQSLLLCNHALTHLFPNFTMSPLHSSTAYSVESKRCWTDVFRMIGNYTCVKNLESTYHQGFTKPILMSTVQKSSIFLLSSQNKFL